MAICERCQKETPPEELRDYAGRSVCEDCYMDLLSPTRMCDPWAIYSSSRMSDQELGPHQEKIMALIASQGRASEEEMLAATGLDAAALKRELASLRHMKLIIGERLPGGRVAFKPFE